MASPVAAPAASPATAIGHQAAGFSGSPPSGTAVENRRADASDAHRDRGEDEPPARARRRALGEPVRDQTRDPAAAEERRQPGEDRGEGDRLPLGRVGRAHVEALRHREEGECREG